MIQFDDNEAFLIFKALRLAVTLAKAEAERRGDAPDDNGAIYFAAGLVEGRIDASRPKPTLASDPRMTPSDMDALHKIARGDV